MGKRNLAGLACLLVAIVAVPHGFADSYYVLIPIGIKALPVIGLSLLLGYAGQISLGHAAFFAIGAYASGVLTSTYGWSPYLAALGGVVLCCVIALMIGVPALRLHGHYLAMATLAFGVIVHVILVAWVPVTGGPSGIGGIPSLSMFGYVFEPLLNDLGLFYLVWGIVLIGMVIALNLIYSRIGRALRSIHGGEDAARVLGVNTAAYKIRVFVLSSAYCSIAGSLYAHNMQHLNPAPFHLMTSIVFVLMVIVGGMRSVWGALSGAVLLGLLQEWLSALQNYWVVLYGLILLLVMMFIPQGVLLALRDVLVAGINFFRRRLVEGAS